MSCFVRQLESRRKTKTTPTFKYDVYENPVVQVDLVTETDEVSIEGLEKGQLLSVTRPTTSSFCNFFLARLSAHKRFNNGEKSAEIVLKDLARLLHGHPEGAVIAAMDFFIEKDTSPFFPSTAEIIAKVELYTRLIDNACLAFEAGENPPVKRPWHGKQEFQLTPEDHARRAIDAIGRLGYVPNQVYFFCRAMERLRCAGQPPEDLVEFEKQLAENAKGK